MQNIRRLLHRKGFINIHRMMNEEFSKLHRRKGFHKTLSEKEYKRRLVRDSINHENLNNFNNHKKFE